MLDVSYGSDYIRSIKSTSFSFIVGFLFPLELENESMSLPGQANDLTLVGTIVQLLTSTLNVVSYYIEA